MPTTETQLKGKDFKSTVPPVWCPGCGDYGVLNGVLNSFAELGYDYDETVIVSGIGCSSRFPFFVKGYGVHTAHGRALPVATGVKLANPALNVIVTGGDGDGFSIGGGHVPHVARKNVDVTYLMMDNRIYGLTKGQVSPTSGVDMVTATTPYGSPDEPVDPVSYTLTYGASFVARGFSGNPKQLRALIIAALTHKGFAFVDIISPCPTFNKVNTFKSYSDAFIDIPEDHDSTDRVKALDLAINGLEGKMPTGIFYKQERETYMSRLAGIKTKSEGTNQPDLEAILDMYKP